MERLNRCLFNIIPRDANVIGKFNFHYSESKTKIRIFWVQITHILNEKFGKNKHSWKLPNDILNSTSTETSNDSLLYSSNFKVFNLLALGVGCKKLSNGNTVFYKFLTSKKLGIYLTLKFEIALMNPDSH